LNPLLPASNENTVGVSVISSFIRNDTKKITCC
jgi:hypothetical protein